MNILEFVNVSKSFFTQKLYDNINITVDSNEKIALIGNNGTGKTTFIRLIKDDEMPDEGEIISNEESTISYFEQLDTINVDLKVSELLDIPFKKVISAQKKMEEVSQKFTDDLNENDILLKEYSRLTDEFESLGGYSYIHLQEEFIDIFGLNEKLNRKFFELSGGEKQYIRLASVLFLDSDLIILDEPLSYFDNRKTAWLSSYIQKSRKAFLIISHNVDFIRSFATKILDIDNYTVSSYQCGYEKYLKEKKEKLLEEKKKNQATDLVIEKTVKAVTKKNILLEKVENKHAQAVVLRRMEKELEKLDKEKIPLSAEYKYKYEATPKEVYISKRTVDEEILSFENMSKEFPDKLLYKDVNFKMYRDSKICLVGENGSGKSTLLKILTDKEKITSGEFKIDKKVKIAFIEQETVFENEKLSTIDYLMKKTGLPIEFVENAIDSLYNYEPEFRDKRIFMLSGGEKRRLEIFANILAEIDLLIIDEPSTYMDEYSRVTVANMLKKYTGAVILVTHDKSLLKKVDFEIYDIRDNRIRKKEFAGK